MASIVCYELEDSPFFLNIDSFVFYFSSLLYKNKFNRTYKEYLRNETLKLGIKYKMIVDADEMLLLALYKTIEKRGFRVLFKGNEIEKDYYIDCTLNSIYSDKLKR